MLVFGLFAINVGIAAFSLNMFVVGFDGFNGVANICEHSGIHVGKRGWFRDINANIMSIDEVNIISNSSIGFNN